MNKLHHLPLNGDMLTYWHTRSHFMMMFLNSKIKYYLPHHWYIVPLTKDVVPCRIMVPALDQQDSITVASSMIVNESNLLTFIRRTVIPYNDPTLTELKTTHGRTTTIIDLTQETTDV